MATRKVGYVLVRIEDDVEAVKGYYASYAEAEADANFDDEIFEVSAVWKVERQVKLTKRKMGEIFGE